MALVFTPVTSSNLEGIGYDADTQELQVTFLNGSRYSYPDVPPDLYERFLAAESPGKFFGTEVRPSFQGRKL